MAKIIYCLIFAFCVLIVDSSIVRDVYWRDYIPGSIPHDAIKGAKGRYIGQINHLGNLVATIYVHSNQAVATHGTKVVKTDPTIKILCSSSPERFYWEFVNFNNPIGTQMENAVIGGYQYNVMDYLYIGKVIHEGEWKIGRVHPIEFPVWKGLWVWDVQGKQVGIQEFYLLKYNYTIVTESGIIAFET